MRILIQPFSVGELIRGKPEEVCEIRGPYSIISHLKEMAKDDGAYKISRLTHVLQCATRAYRDDANDDWIIAALLHDLGDTLAPFTHGQVAAEIIFRKNRFQKSPLKQKIH